MSNIFITDVVGTGDFAVPTTDAELATATTELETLLSGVANLTYDRVLAWVEDSGGPGGVEGTRTLNCLVEKFTYLAKECPNETQVDTMIAAIESALEADADITSVGNQQVHIVQAGAYFLWNRDASGGFLYPNTPTDDVVVGPFGAPNAKWFDDGDMVLGAVVMSGTEKLRVVGDVRVEGKLTVTGVIDPTDLVFTEQADHTTAPAAGVGILWVRNDAPNVLVFTDDVGTDTVLGAGSLWTQGAGFAYLTQTAESVVIGDNALTGNEKLKVDGGDILVEGGNINLPGTASASVGVIEFFGTQQMHIYGQSSIFLGGAGNFTAGLVDDVVAIGGGALAAMTSVSTTIAIGVGALSNATSGGGGTIAIGANTGTGITSGAQTNLIIGNSVMTAATIARENVVIGHFAYNVGTQSHNVVIGWRAAEHATSAGQNVIIGHGAASTGVMTGDTNVIIGTTAGNAMTLGSNNNLIGRGAGASNTSGTKNNALGNTSLFANTTGHGNVAIGELAMADDGVGGGVGSLNRNVALGEEALRYIEAATNDNVAVGYRAMRLVQGSGATTNNVAIGSGAGATANGANSCVYIGYQAGTNNATSNRLIIENSNNIATPLIDGDFNGNTLTFNGAVTVTGKLTVGGLIDPTGMVFDEQAVVPGGAPGAAKGTLWVRNDTPNVLVFTNDVGADTVLGAGGSSPWTSVAGVIYPTTITDAVAIGTTTLEASEKLHVFDDDETGDSDGLVVQLEKNAASTKSSWDGITVWCNHTGDAGVTNDYDGVRSILIFDTASAQTLPAWTGYKAQPVVVNNGNVTLATFFLADGKSGTGTVDTAFCFRAAAQGTTTDVAYGLYIDPLGATTNSYAIWQEGSSDLSVFKGDVAIGTTSMSGTEKLRVVGDVIISGTGIIGTTSLLGAEKVHIFDDDETGDSDGLVVQLEKNAASTKSSWDGITVWCNHTGDAGVTNDYDGVRSILIFDTASAQTLPAWTGYKAQPVVVNNGNVTLATFFLADGKSGTGTVDTAFCFRAAAQGTTTDVAYGLYIDPLGATTNSYAIWQEGSSDLSVFKGDVAIGTTSMSGTEKLRVVGDVIISGTGIIGTTSLLGAEKVHIFDDDETGDSDGLVVQLEKNAASTKSSWDGITVWCNHTGDAGVTNDYDGVRSILIFDTASAQTLPAWTGYKAQPVVVNNGNVTLATFFLADGKSGTGTVDTAFCFRAAAQGTTTDVAYGLYIDPLGATTNSYAIWQEGSSDLSVFKGDVAIGTTSMSGTEKLRVVGDVRVEGKLTVTGVIDPTDLVFTEQADHTTAPAAGLGILWVRDDAPNVLVFTDDVGTDTVLGTGGSSPWTTTANVIHPGILTDQVGVGKTTGAGFSELMFIIDDEETGSGSTLVVELEKNSTGTRPSWIGVNAIAIHTGTGAGTDYRAVVGNITVSAAATITDAYAFFADGRVNNASAEITNFYGYYVDTPASIGVLDNAYGLYISTLNADSDSFGVYQSDSGDRNYFAGRVGIGVEPGGGSTGDLQIQDNSDTATTYGVEIDLVKTTAAVKTSWVGLRVGQSLASGTVTDSRAIEIRTPTTGTVTTSYGLYINSMDVSSTTSYGVFQTGISDLNFFAGRVGIGTNPISNSKTYIFVDDGDSIGEGLRVHFQKNAVAGQTIWTGISSRVNYTANSSSTSIRMFDSIPVVGTAGGVTFTNLTSYHSAPETGSADTFTKVIHFHASISEIDGTIVDYYGLKVDDPNPIGTLTNSYGVYIEAMSGGTLSYGIYQADAGDKNYFAGRVGVNTSTLSGTLTPYLIVDDSEDSAARTGIEVNVTKDGAGANKQHHGFRSTMSHTGAANADLYVGHRTDFTLNASGRTVNDAYGFLTSCNVSSGTLVDYYGFYASTNGSVGTITNAYGLYIGGMNGDTSSWGVYQTATGDKNYFAGQVGFGTSTPLSAAQVEIEPNHSDRGSLVRGLLIDLNVTSGALSNVGACLDVDTDYTSSTDLSTYNSIRADFNHDPSAAATLTSIVNYRSQFRTGKNGTIARAYHFRAATPPASAGSIAIVYGFYVDDLDLGNTVANAYGLYIENQTASALNYGIWQDGTDDTNILRGKTGIGGSTVATSAVLDIQSTTGALIVSRMTTSQRNALTAVDGMIIYDTSTSAFNFRENGSWVTGSGLA